MQVLFLLTQSLGYPSGLGRYWPLARQMVRLGFKVEIAALHPAWLSLRQREFIQDGVRVTYVGQMHVYEDAGGNRRQYFGSLELVRVTAAATAALARIALSRQADVIHIAKAQPMNGLAGWLSSWLGSRKLYLDCDDDEAASNRFGSEWQRSIVRWWESNLPGVARGITVNTSFLRDRCLRMGVPPHRVRLIPNGFDPDRFRPLAAPEIESVRRRWGLDNRRVVLYLGSISLTNHPIGLLLEAFEQVRRSVPSAVLLVVGGGDDYDKFARMIRDRELSSSVVLAGRVDPAAVAPIFAASELSVDPVYDDYAARARSPLKIVESLAMGVPVVTGDVGDRAAMIANGRVGILVQPGSAQALADGIMAALQDPARRESMANTARAASQCYRWDRLVRDFVQIYNVA
ncbi:MAG: glycosyltransferase family 4 protein [Chloroflexi bacterium]|nr:glycosyltransferase family 4 protein [Chloroflexota bacterium]